MPNLLQMSPNVAFGHLCSATSACLLSFSGFHSLELLDFGYYMPEDVDRHLKSELVLDAV